MICGIRRIRKGGIYPEQIAGLFPIRQCVHIGHIMTDEVEAGEPRDAELRRGFRLYPDRFRACLAARIGIVMVVHIELPMIRPVGGGGDTQKAKLTVTAECLNKILFRGILVPALGLNQAGYILQAHDHPLCLGKGNFLFRQFRRRCRRGQGKGICHHRQPNAKALRRFHGVDAAYRVSIFSRRD